MSVFVFIQLSKWVDCVVVVVVVTSAAAATALFLPLPRPSFHCNEVWSAEAWSAEQPLPPFAPFTFVRPFFDQSSSNIPLLILCFPLPIIVPSSCNSQLLQVTLWLVRPLYALQSNAIRRICNLC